MNQKPNILITNDDSIHAPGIKHLWQALQDTCDLKIVAPASEKSGVGMCLTLWDPIHIHTVDWHKDTPAWKVTGTPADCVRLATSQLLTTPPDLVVSGINRGANSGRTILYSGTIAGVIEATMRDIPGIAFSCQDYENPNYAQFEQYVYPLVRYVLDHPLPRGCFLNVNFPATKKVQGIKMTRQGMSIFKDDTQERTHPDGYSYYWMSGKWQAHPEHEHSDVKALENGFISASPIYVHELTHLEVISSRKKHFEDILNF
ncbi:MAG: 5'/3'-nucleotidase SurE [Chlamydiae bacterium]|nr:5'/3'-nucleotidase SurE [Chlamydiota bacterium]